MEYFCLLYSESCNTNPTALKKEKREEKIMQFVSFLQLKSHFNAKYFYCCCKWVHMLYENHTNRERERQREEQKEMRRAQNKSFLYADAKNIVKVTY